MTLLSLSQIYYNSSDPKAKKLVQYSAFKTGDRQMIDKDFPWVVTSISCNVWLLMQ